MRIYISIVFLIIFSVKGLPQGLQFQGHGKLMEERPSYSVFGNRTPQFKNQFTVSFDISFYDIEPFGYIFLLKDEKTNVEYNLIYAYKENEKNSLFKFNIEGKDNLITLEIGNEVLSNRTWLNFSCTFFLAADSIQISINNKEYTVKNLNLPKDFYPQLVFGKNTNSVDIPSFSIRKLSVKSGKQEYNFLLDESEGEDVHNDKGVIVGHISNPIWLINSAYYWKPRFKYSAQAVSGVNYNESAQSMLFFNKDSITTFNLKTNTSSTKSYINKFPLDMRLGMSFFDNNGRLYAYEVCDYSGMDTDTTFAYLDDKNNKWIPLKPKALPMQLHHHTGFFDLATDRYILFGGFGNQRYNKEFLYYDISTNKWDTLALSGDKIMPRFFQGMAVAKEKRQFYIFGGLGNESGDQTVGRHNFYDLYRIDLNENKIVRLWNIEWNGKNVVPARNMIMLNDSSFYALCYPEYEPNSYLQLYQFSTNDGSYKILGDSIPFRSDKITTNVNLYYSHLLNEFYCTIQEFEDDGSSVSSIYSLSYPAISKESLTTYSKSENMPKLWLIAVSIMGILSFCFFIFYKKRKEQQKEDLLLPYAETTVNNIILPHNKKNSIYLFGDFCLYDKKGKDITYMLSNRLKYTFLIIVQYSIENGISSQLLSESLWANKDEYNVKNLRGVTLNQLRKVLSELDGIDLIFDKGHFKIIMTDDCYCDCNRFLDLISADGENLKGISEVKDILSRGIFLNSIDDTLLSPFKEYIRTKIISILPIYIENVFEAENYLLALHLSDILIMADKLNVDALSWQVQSLYKLKQTNEAKKRYALFAGEYERIMNNEFSISFSSILKNERI